MILTTLRAAWKDSLNAPLRAPARFWRAGVAIVKSTFSADILVVNPKSEARLNACIRCPIYDPKWQACGDGVKKLENGQYVGCLCYMPFKVTIPTATCWLHDQGVTDQGWPKE